MHAAPDGEHLEELAHLGGRQQLLRLGGDRRVVQGILDVRLGQDVGDAAVHQELRLRGIAEHLEAGLARRLGEGAEVDVRGDVLPARLEEHVAVRAVAVVAHQRAHRALRMVVLVARKAVVDDEDRAVLQALAERAHPGAAPQARSRFRRGSALRSSCACVPQPSGRWPLLPAEFSV